MMRPLGKCVLTFGVFMVLASPAWAQRRGGFAGGGGGFGGGAAFLRSPEVQKDLKLSSDQIAKIQETLQSTREKHQDDFTGLRDASPEERRSKMATLNKTITDEVKKGLALSDEQSKRFDQISVQAQGIQAFNSPAVASKLELSDEQKTKIREIAGAGGGQGRGAFNKDASEEERAEARKKRAATSQANMAKVLDTLTDAQKASWKELIGTPIEIRIPLGRNN